MPPDHVKKAQQQAIQTDTSLASTKPLSPLTQPQTSLDQLLNDPQAQWQFSSGGGGGASLVTSPSSTGGGAAIKIESNQNIDNAERSAKFMEEFFSRVATKDPNAQAPFLTPRVRLYRQDEFTKNPGLQTELDSRLDEQKTPTLDRSYRIDDHKQNLTSMMTKDDCSVFVMEYGQGQALHTLPTEDKEALIRSRTFPEAVGKSMALCIALGMKDHLGDPSNPSNVLYDKTTGTLSLIDYDAGSHGITNGHPVVGGNNDNPAVLARMRAFLEQATSSPDNFQKALDQMMHPVGDHPFHSVMQTMMKRGSHPGEFLFTFNEDPATVQDISLIERRDFAAHLLNGAIEGLAYLQTHKQSLKEAALSTHQNLKDGTKVEHFYDQSKLSSLEQEIDKFDVAKLRNGMNNVLKHREQNLGSEIKALEGLQDRAFQIKQLIDRRRNKPTAWEKVKDTFGWSSAISRLNTEFNKTLDLLRVQKLSDLKPGDYSKTGDLKERTAFRQAANNPHTNAPSNQVTGTTKQTVAQQINTPSKVNAPNTTQSLPQVPSPTPSQSPTPVTPNNTPPKPSTRDTLSSYIGPNATQSLPPLPQVPSPSPSQSPTPVTQDNDPNTKTPKVRDVVRQDQTDTPNKIGPRQKL